MSKSVKKYMDLLKKLEAECENWTEAEWDEAWLNGAVELFNNIMLSSDYPTDEEIGNTPLLAASARKIFNATLDKVASSLERAIADAYDSGVAETVRDKEKDSVEEVG